MERTSSIPRIKTAIALILIIAVISCNFKTTKAEEQSKFINIRYNNQNIDKIDVLIRATEYM